MGARNFLTTIFTAALAIFLSGCFVTYSPSVPEGYAGPLANVKDSADIRSEQEVVFFYLAAIDGADIKNSPTETRIANSGRGFHMTPLVLDHDIPARETTVTIIGRNEYAADILAIMNPVYQVKGDVAFRPDSDGAYIVKGELKEDYSAVWIEDLKTGEIVTTKVEVYGSAKLGFFGK